MDRERQIDKLGKRQTDKWTEKDRLTNWEKDRKLQKENE